MPARHDEQDDQLNRLRQQRADRRSQVLAELLERRPELWGVHSPADLAAESVRWAA